MAFVLIANFTICFIFGLLLIGRLTHYNILELHRTQGVLWEYNHRPEVIVIVVLSSLLVILELVGIGTSAAALHFKKETYYWLDMVVVCNLQILVSMNVRRFTCSSRLH